jgi:hypothetical protein
MTKVLIGHDVVRTTSDITMLRTNLTTEEIVALIKREEESKQSTSEKRISDIKMNRYGGKR